MWTSIIYSSKYVYVQNEMRAETENMIVKCIFSRRGMWSGSFVEVVYSAIAARVSIACESNDGTASTRIISWKLFRKSFWLNVFVQRSCQLICGAQICDAALLLYFLVCLSIHLAFVHKEIDGSMALVGLVVFHASFFESNKYGTPCAPNYFRFR